VIPRARQIGSMLGRGAVRSRAHIVSFFQTAIEAIHANDHDRAKRILANLSEPNETRLGLSKAKPSGRGVSGKQAFDLYEALVDSEAAKAGILTEIAECDLFIPGISTDKVSDITTNVIRGPLVEYTQRQCELHGIALHPDIPAGKFWDMDLLDWTAHYARLPVWQDQKILLVPKASVRFRLSFDSQEYFNHFVLDFLQVEHLRAGSALVETLKNGRRRVFLQLDAHSLRLSGSGRGQAATTVCQENERFSCGYKRSAQADRKSLENPLRLPSPALRAAATAAQVVAGKQALRSNRKAGLAVLRLPPPGQAKLAGQR
jgi:hypothetical protein